MKYRSLPMTIAALFSVVVLGLARPLYAYIDPGAGSYLIQVLIGVLLGAAVSVRIFWKSIKAKARSLFQPKRDESDETAD